MQKVAFLFYLVFVCTKGFTQQGYFMYIQTDDRTPFYTRISNQMFSSSENGYLIIPKLQESMYEITIGFAKNAFPEQKFEVKLDKKNRGFVLKNLREKGWALVSLQTAEVIPSAFQAAKSVSEFSGTRKTDLFSEMLANVVNDSAILYNSVRPKPAVAAEDKSPAGVTTQTDQRKDIGDSVQKSTGKEALADNQPVAKQDTTLSATPIAGIVLKENAPPATIKAKDSSASKENHQPLKDIPGDVKPAVEKAFLTKLEESKTEEMYQATYLELYNLTTDTIRIFIPLKDSSGSTSSPPSNIIGSEIEKKPSQDLTTKVSVNVMQDSGTVTKSKPEIVNSDCKNFATDYDVDKLRVKLLDDKTIDDKLASAKKFFKLKCYSVGQIKALTELFPSDETKYRFFDTSYAYISDTGSFYTLEDLISNDYFKSKFKALIHR